MTIQIAKILQTLQPELNALEAERTAVKKTLFLLPLPFLLALIINLLIPQASFLAALIFLIGPVMIGGLFFLKILRYRSNYRNQVAPALLEFITPKLHFDGSSGISSEQFSNSELFRTTPHWYRSEGLFWGKYKKTDVQLAEVRARSIRISKYGHVHLSTTFKGILFVADFHKDFQGRTFLMPDKAEYFFGNAGRSIQDIAGRQNTKLLQLEDPEFEKVFAVHSNNQIEGRYILSSSMMQGILEVRNKFKQSDIRLAFKNSAVWIAVPYRHHFLEASIRTPATNTLQIQSLLEGLELFLEIVDELNLNTRIWTKK